MCLVHGAPLTDNTAILCVVIGCAALAVGTFGKQFYYGKAGWGRSNRPAPRWYGRMIFFIVAGLFILAGVSHLLMAH
jgi:hypothetical protein